MNERIKELAAQAGFGASGDPYHRQAFDVNQFAELIAQECMECVRDVLRDEASDLTYEAADQVQGRIRRVFDIQE